MDLIALLLLGGAAALLSDPSPVTTSTSMPSLPPPPPSGLPIDPYATRDLAAAGACDPTPKPGVKAFRDRVLRLFGGHDLGIVRACNVGGPSEHKEGRAWDFGCDPATGDLLCAWLLATDADGNEHALARRAGVMYLIWRGQIWGAYAQALGWRPYHGASEHRDHVHVSFSRAGASGLTSFYAAPAA